MGLKADQQRVKALLSETITLLCKNGLNFRKEFTIEGLIGITLDQDDIFLVSIKETIRSAVADALPKEPVASGKGPLAASGVQSSSRRRNREGVIPGAEVKRSDSPQMPVISNVSAGGDGDEGKSEYPNLSTAGDLASVASQSTVTMATTKLENTSSHDDAMIVSESVLPGSSLPPGSQQSSSADPPNLNLTFSDIPTDDNSASVGGGVAKRRRLTNRPVSSSLGSCNEGVSAQFEGFQQLTEQQQQQVMGAGKTEQHEETDFIEIKDELLSENDHDESQEEHGYDYGDYSGPGGVYGAQEGDPGMDPGEMFAAGMMGAELIPRRRSAPQGNGSGLSRQDPSCGWQQMARSRPWMNRSARERAACPECGKFFSLQCNLRMHRRTVHMGLFQYTCDICGKGVRRWDELRSHLFAKHGMQRLKCPNSACDKILSSREELGQHVLYCKN